MLDTAPIASDRGPSLNPQPVVAVLDWVCLAIERIVRIPFLIFLRPSTAVEESGLIRSRLAVPLFALTYGMSSTYVISAVLAGGESSLIPRESWADFWLFVFLTGLVAGMFAYFCGGWWFQLRLWFCGVNPVDRAKARRVYLTLTQIFAVPLLACALVVTLCYPSAKLAYAAPSPWFLLLGVFNLWFIFATYRAVAVAFRGSRSRIRFWFLLFPLLPYAQTLFSLVGVSAHG